MSIIVNAGVVVDNFSVFVLITASELVDVTVVEVVGHQHIWVLGSGVTSKLHSLIFF